MQLAAGRGHPQHQQAELGVGQSTVSGQVGVDGLHPIAGVDAESIVWTHVPLARQQYQQAAGATAVRMAPDSVTAHRMSMMAANNNAGSATASANAAGLPAGFVTPFTPQQQQALMRITGGSMSSQTASLAQQYQYQYQNQYAMMLQVQAHAAAAQQRQALQRLPEPYLQAHSRATAPAMQQASHLQTSPSMAYIHGGMAPQMHSRPGGYAGHHPALASITSSAASFDEEAFQIFQQQQYYQQPPQSSAVYHHSGQSTAASPPASSSRTPRQIHFVGGEPATGYRLITQSQTE